MSTLVRSIAGMLLIAAAPVVATERTSITAVTPLPNHQIRVCWDPVENAMSYWIEGSDDVENVVVMNTSGDESCRDVNLYGGADCTYGFATVSVATGADNTFGPASDRFYFLRGTAYAVDDGAVAIDQLAAAPICSPEDRYPTIEASTRMGPADLEVRDVTTASDDRPRVRIRVRCPDPTVSPATGLDHWEIYESTLKADGSTTTRTTSRESCPDGTELRGEWGDRTTFTVAAIYRDSDALSHSLCSAPQVVTYGSSLLASPSATVTASTIGGTAAKGTRDLVVLSRNGQRLSEITSVKASGAFSSPFPEKVEEGERLFVVAHRTLNGHDVFSEPAAIHADDRGADELVMNDLPPYAAAPGLLFVSGVSKPFERIHVRIADSSSIVAQSDFFSCANGTFGGHLALDDAMEGEYVLSANAGDATAGAKFHLNEVYPAPRISLDQGAGPFAVDGDRAVVRGRVTPVLTKSSPLEEDSDDAQASSPYEVTVSVNGGETAEMDVDDNGEFVATLSHLHRGENSVRFEVTHRATSAEGTPVEIAIVRGRKANGVDLAAANNALGESMRYLADGDFEKALHAASDAIAVNPDSPRAYGIRAAASIRTDDVEGAYRDALRATELDPRSPEGFAYRTNYFVAQSKWSDVIDWTTRALELNASMVLAWDNRALARLELGRFDQAISDATMAISILDSNFYARDIRAKAFLLKGDFGSAVNDAREAVSINGDYGAARITYARALQHFGQAADALAQLDAMTDAQPDSASVWNSRAWAEYKMGLIDKSIEHATRSIAVHENPFALGTRAWSRAAKGEVAGALEDLDKAVALEPGYSGGELDAGLALYLRGDFAGASKTWREALLKYADETDAVMPLLEKAEAKQK